MTTNTGPTKVIGHQARLEPVDELFAENIIMINTCSFVMSTVMTEKEIECLGRALVDAFTKIKGLL